MKNRLPSQSRASSQPAGSGSSSPGRPELSRGIATRLDPLPCVRSRGEQRSRSLHHFQESGGVKIVRSSSAASKPSGGASTAAPSLLRPGERLCFPVSRCSSVLHVLHTSFLRVHIREERIYITGETHRGRANRKPSEGGLS
ncbi:hypothetical protein CesoFtcFv8_005622 [Champsocephalus esox]|uniref:Uncharacterized protein n=1 Tax=Champsocephalus esox TaxID=159716 RepID=A0AAN8CPS0_9TELE|nr:hypothetical protein CesoFtcFv8_005622 [Champsocephalus esox]